MQRHEPWQEWMSRKQQKLLNAACGDLADQLPWRYNGMVVRMKKDEWRHLIAATVLGAKFVDGIDGGLVALGRSSLDLEGPHASEAIDLAFALGDAPDTFGITGRKRVVWCHSVCLARGISPNDDQLADQYGD